jgi:hypothetical protein
MDKEGFIQQSDDKFVVIATKLSRTAAERLARIAKAKDMTIYEIIKMVCDTLIRYCDDRHNLTAEMEQAMSVFEHMIGWADAVNLADPNIQKEVAQAIYIMQDAEGKKRGFRVAMVSKPWMGIWDQTENVMQIFERIFNVLMPELYMKLYRAKIILECNSVSEVINMLADAEVIAHLNEELRQDFENAGRTESGRQYAYGRRTKGHPHRTPDSVDADNRLQFEDFDRDKGNVELKEWEGEYHDTR